MSEKISHRYETIKNVTPITKKHWAVKVLVLEKSYERISANTSKSFQRLVLQDKEGTKVQAHIFGPDIGLFANTLKLLHRYHISNAAVSSVDPQYRIVPNDYKWIINSRTPVIELTDDEEASAIIPVFNFIKFADFHKYINSKIDIDIVAVVVDVLPLKTVTTKYGPSIVQELIITNEELKPTTLTLWNNFVENEAEVISKQADELPIIIAMHLHVISYNELSLRTKSCSSFLINPDVQEAITLRSWVLENEAILKEMKIKNQYHATSRDLKPSSRSTIKISDLPQSLTNGMVFQIEALASIRNTNQNFWYTCCSNNACNKKIEAKPGTSYPCVHCKQTVTAQPRVDLKQKIELQDQSGSLTATIYGNNAEKIFPFTVSSIIATQKQLKKENKNFDITSFGEVENKGPYIVSIKVKTRENSYVTFNVSAISDINTHKADFNSDVAAPTSVPDSKTTTTATDPDSKTSKKLKIA